jgi:hypothetical protein
VDLGVTDSAPTGLMMMKLDLDPSNPVSRVFFMRCRIHPDTVEQKKKEPPKQQEVPIASSAPSFPDSRAQAIIKMIYA